MPNRELVTRDCWDYLRTATSARIGLGRAGGSLPTSEWLHFKAAHAAARDAVHNEFDAEKIAAEIGALGAEAMIVSSAAEDRATYLQRPDLGRQLNPASRRDLEARGSANSADLAIIVCDGLSALAVHHQAAAVLQALLPKLHASNWKLAPIVVARFARVALQDEVGELLNARMALTLIGERPGLGSPDSLGAYLVFNPRRGNTDANRNCVSNIRPEGLPPSDAAETIFYLLSAARTRGLTGVHLKDDRLLTRPARRELE